MLALARARATSCLRDDASFAACGKKKKKDNFSKTGLEPKYEIEIGSGVNKDDLAP